MKLFRVTIALALLGLFAGCGEPQVDLSTTKTHRSGAITFDYPKNWEISDDSLTPEIHYLFVETPGDALVVFQSYPIDEANGLTDFSKAFSKSAATETPIGKVEQSTFSAIPEASGYEWIEEEFSIKFLSESIPHRRLYGTKMIGDRQVFLILQVATEDYARAEPGFELIRNSLRSIQEAEQDGADQPATVLKSKSEGKEKPTTESKVRSQ
jgi:predicted Zn-dependent protease